MSAGSHRFPGVCSLIHSPTGLEVTTPKAEMSSPTGLPWRARIRRGLWAEAQHLAGAREDALVRDVECAVGSEDEPARRDEIRHDRGARAVRVHPQQNARPGESWSDGEFENVEPLVRTPPDVDDRREARPVDRRRLPRDDAVDVRPADREWTPGQLADVVSAVRADRDRRR